MTFELRLNFNLLWTDVYNTDSKNTRIEDNSLGHLLKKIQVFLLENYQWIEWRWLHYFKNPSLWFVVSIYSTFNTFRNFFTRISIMTMCGLKNIYLRFCEYQFQQSLSFRRMYHLLKNNQCGIHLTVRQLILVLILGNIRRLTEWSRWISCQMIASELRVAIFTLLFWVYYSFNITKNPIFPQ